MSQVSSYDLLQQTDKVLQDFSDNVQKRMNKIRYQMSIKISPPGIEKPINYDLLETMKHLDKMTVDLENMMKEEIAKIYTEKNKIVDGMTDPKN
jgi:hypothetical protein